MLKEFKDKFPSWVFEDGDYTVCLSDDLDSLVGASILKHVKGWEIKHFYDFHNLYSMEKDNRKAVGVDIALENGMTFDNHVTRLSKNDRVNTLSANPNVIENISRENYTEKYAMSTTLLMWSLFDIPLPETDEGKLLLLSIDSSYQGHYNEKFKSVQNGWLKKLGFEELIDIQNTYTLKDFADVKKKYNSSLKIGFDRNGVLIPKKDRHGNMMNIEAISEILNLKIELPKNTFYLRKCFFSTEINLYKNKYFSKEEIEKKNDNEIFSLALTKKFKISLTYKFTPIGETND
ncbi:hypothetical protein LYSIN_01564 [Lysinibacillus sphaericus]|uniref:Uncharacterized protein n=1 Tax=Lysinibacillus sphaericus TaxID=1421 RepID=A0A2S5D153_LYSSH|nr:hypothetical protein [Lysinibacillus sphaericus]POZ56781.1 hypothetical protein LYSIN_01564 [Lysinibacillus sphaericus]